VKSTVVGSVVTLAFLVTSPSLGQQFRIETFVYRDQDKTPISENLTLFHDGLVYDFLLGQDRSAEEIAIYDSRGETFVLINVARRVRTEITLVELMQRLEAFKTSGVIKPEDRFLIDAEFTEDYDPANGLLTLKSDQLTYRVRGQQVKDEAAWHALVDFMDQFARLNVTDPRRMPPFARLRVNQSIRQRRLVPTEVALEIQPAGRLWTAPVKVRAEHYTVWQLSREDLKRIDVARRFWVDFPAVSLAEFRQLDTATPTSADVKR